MSRVYLFLAAVFMLLPNGAAADTMTFKDVPGGGIETVQSTYIEGNITATSVHGSFWAFSQPGTLHLDPVGLGPAPGLNSEYLFTHAHGRFSALNFDIAFGGQYGLLTWTALDSANNLIATFAVNTTSSGTVYFPQTFVGLTTLRLLNTPSPDWTSIAGPSSTHASIDNLVITTPEPGAFSMLLLGLGTFVCLRRFLPLTGRL